MSYSIPTKEQAAWAVREKKATALHWFVHLHGPTHGVSWYDTLASVYGEIYKEAYHRGAVDCAQELRTSGQLTPPTATDEWQCPPPRPHHGTTQREWLELKLNEVPHDSRDGKMLRYIADTLGYFVKQRITYSLHLSKDKS